jgi:predicted acyltransferase
MSLPLALRSRLRRGEPTWKVLTHLVTRTLSLLFIGVLMVNGTPDSTRLGWSGSLWTTLMYFSAILAFSTVTFCENPSRRLCRSILIAVRLLGFGSLLWLAFAYRGRDGHVIVSLSPFSIHHQWYGILGLIGWAYLVGGIVYLVFGTNRTALLGCAVLLMCLYPADRTGAFSNFWLARHVGIGATLGSHAAITVAGLLLATALLDPNGTPRTWTQSTLLFVAGCAAAALLLDGLYGINKNQATPSWCLWACAITAALWLILHFLDDQPLTKPAIQLLAVAGQNVFLAYLLSEMIPSLLDLAHATDWYAALATPHLWNAVARSAAGALMILGATAGLNALGFRLKL